MNQILDLLIHFDKYLETIVTLYGSFTYPILFLIIFLETGLVITPFLPGDSMIFIVGTLASKNLLSFWLLFLVLSLAAILGDTLNYWIGKYFGENFFLKRKLIRKENLDKTKQFYEEHGGKTIILARFIPIVRTFAPFIAGVGRMKYFRFLLYNIIGGVSWVGIFLAGGYYFGTIPFVQKNLTLVIVLILLTSFIPPAYELIKRKLKKSKNNNI